MRALASLGIGIALLTMASITYTAQKKAVKVFIKGTITKILSLEQELWMQKPETHNSQPPHQLSDSIAVFLLSKHQDWNLPWAQEILRSGTLSSENAAKLIEYHKKEKIIIEIPPNTKK